MRTNDYEIIFDGVKATAKEPSDNTQCNSIKNRIFSAIYIKRGTLISDETYGSRLWMVKKNTKSAPLEAKNHILNALDTLVRDGSISNPSCEVEINNNNKIIANVACKIDGVPANFEMFLPI
jgi:phage gp46-like protein